MPVAFISYSRVDGDFARRLHEALDERGIDSWIDFADMPPGSDWRGEVVRAIESVDVLLFVVSPQSCVSYECLLELDQAVRLSKRVIPLLRSEPDPAAVPDALRSPDWIPFREEDDFGRALDVLVEALNEKR